MTRYEKGKQVIESIQKRSLEEIFEAIDDIAPDMSRFVVEFPYSEIYTRDEVDLKTRELCTVAALTVLGTVPQLKDHINAALNVGNSPTEVVEIKVNCLVFFLMLREFKVSPRMKSCELTCVLVCFYWGEWKGEQLWL